MKGKISDIEILRGFAILLVLITHVFINLIPLKTETLRTMRLYLDGGWTGVDLFFAISGFVITKSLLSNTNHSDENPNYLSFVKRFWVKRVFRLLPSAWFWIVFTLLLNYFFNKSNAFADMGNNIDFAISAIFFFANYQFYEVIMAGQHAGPFMIYWSLSLEEQFYIALPILLFFFRKHFVSLLIAIILFQMLQDRSLSLMKFFRTDALCLGVLLCIAQQHVSYKNLEPKFLANRLLQPIVLLTCISALILLGSEAFKVPHKLAFIAIVSIFLVWIGSYGKGYINLGGLLNKAFIWLGSRSYGIYLLHLPAFLATREIWFRLSPKHDPIDPAYLFSYLVTATLLIIIFAEVTFKYIETPARNYGVKLANKLS